MKRPIESARACIPRTSLVEGARLQSSCLCANSLLDRAAVVEAVSMLQCVVLSWFWPDPSMSPEARMFQKVIGAKTSTLLRRLLFCLVAACLKQGGCPVLRSEAFELRICFCTFESSLCRPWRCRMPKGSRRGRTKQERVWGREHRERASVPSRQVQSLLHNERCWNAAKGPPITDSWMLHRSSK